MPKTILFADDEEIVREYVVHLLKGWGFTVVEADDGADLLAKAKQCHPDLIISDILMPDMSGYKAIEELRSIKEYKNTPVIFCSGVMKDNETFKTLKPQGPCYFFPKPLETEALKQAIDELLAG